MRALLLVAAWGICSAPLQAKVFDRCSLARALNSNGIKRADTADWVCLAQYESEFNTGVIQTNVDRSKNWGIFQINDYWWCEANDGRKSHNVCRLDCRDMLADNITGAVRCALLVKKRQGFKVWPSWNNKCRHEKVSVQDCFVVRK